MPFTTLSVFPLQEHGGSSGSSVVCSSHEHEGAEGCSSDSSDSGSDSTERAQLLYLPSEVGGPLQAVANSCKQLKASE